MNKSKVLITTQGVKGGNYTPYKRTGKVIIGISDEGYCLSEDRIVVDAFEGEGNTYRSREYPLIKIYENDIPLFIGTKEELFKLLKL